MSFAGAFSAIAARYGQVVSVEKDGTVLGTGRAVLRPVLDRQRQFLPTDLGLDCQEETLCLGEAGLPFTGQAGAWVVRRGETAYDVVNLRAVTAGEETVYWRAVLRRRGEAMP